jgi:hypothetical protein
MTSGPPTGDQVDEALRDLASHAQSPLSGMHRGIASGDLTPLEYFRHGPINALSIVGDYLDLPSDLWNSGGLAYWQMYPLAITGALYDAVLLARALDDADRENYKDFLHFSFTRDRIWSALHHMEKFYRGDAFPIMREIYDLMAQSTSPNKGDAEKALFWIALDPEPNLHAYMPVISQAILDEDHAFFRCLSKAIDWSPPAEKIPPKSLAAMPEHKPSSVRTWVRRYWVSRGLWMFDRRRLRHAIEDLSDSAFAKLTAKGNDRLYQEDIYQSHNGGKKVFCSACGPDILASTLKLHLLEPI